MKSKAGESQIFSPFRAVGFVSNHVPLVLDVKGSDHFVTTAVGGAFHIYNCSKLNLLFVGEVNPLKKDIYAITATTGNKTLVAAGTHIFVYSRGKIVHSYVEHTSEVHILNTIGDLVISIDNENTINVWSHVNLETYVSFKLDVATFYITASVHPSTYLNKVLLGSKQGTMQLWNVKTNSLIYEFPGWNSAIVVLEQAPAVDVIAVGLQSGRIVLHNIKVDKTLMSFNQESGLVTSISFRTDGQPIMATGSSDGHITIWDLEKQEYKDCLNDAHVGSVSGIKFFQKQPLLVSSGCDNSLKVWIFDNSDGSGRLLKSRCGHSAAPNRCIFYGSYGNVILTTGMDRALRYTSIMRGEQCHEFSQGTLIKKSKKTGIQVEDLRLPATTSLAANTSREDDWDNIVTCHVGMTAGVTWSSKKRAIGEHRLKVNETAQDTPTVVDISSCGNFVVIGYKSGSLHMFNIQSGLHRGKFQKHTGSVRGIGIDSANLMVVSTSADKCINFHCFKTKKVLNSISCRCPVTMSKLHRESSLLAVAFDDFTLQIYDIDTQCMVRQLPSHSNMITDISWSSDARWLISASMDGTIKTSDVPSSRLIDCFLVESPVTSCAFSPSGEFLVTTHQDNVGIYLWSNKVTYSGVHPSPLPNNYQPTILHLPTTQTEIQESSLDEESETVDEDMEVGDSSSEYVSPQQLASYLVTLSSLPESRWRSLLHLDLIKKRNKPKEPPKKPKAAPFFIPTISGLETTFDTSKNDNTEEGDENLQSRVLSNKFGDESTLNSLMKKHSASSNNNDNVKEILQVLKKLSPSDIDIEFRQLGLDGGGNDEDLESFVLVLIELIKSGQDFELVQSFVSLFLKLHGDVILCNESLKGKCQLLLETIQHSWEQCQGMLNQSICLVNYLKSATV